MRGPKRAEVRVARRVHSVAERVGSERVAARGKGVTLGRSIELRKVGGLLLMAYGDWARNVVVYRIVDRSRGQRRLEVLLLKLRNKIANPTSS